MQIVTANIFVLSLCTSDIKCRNGSMFRTNSNCFQRSSNLWAIHSGKREKKLACEHTSKRNLQWKHHFLWSIQVRGDGREGGGGRRRFLCSDVRIQFGILSGKACKAINFMYTEHQVTCNGIVIQYSGNVFMYADALCASAKCNCTMQTW